MKFEDIMKTSGFTLIELVVVIVILGIFAGSVGPLFIDFTGDAQAALMKNISANLKTAITFVLLKDKLIGGNNSSIDYNGNTITFISGLPRPDATQMRYLLDMELPSSTFTRRWSTVACSGSEYCIVGNRPYTDRSLPSIAEFTSGTGVFFWPEGYVLSDCFSYYLNLNNGSDPVVNYVITGC